MCEKKPCTKQEHGGTTYSTIVNQFWFGNATARDAICHW